MAITAYTGLPGSGKSYQVVSYVIMNALREGRRVVTNIEGLKDDLISEFLEKEGIHLDEQGEIVHVTNEQISADGFYYQPYSISVVQPGDIVILDECWEWFEDGIPIPPRTMEFFRKHRHYVNEKNVSCDIVLISQDVLDIGRKTRRVIEQTFLMTKLVDVGAENSFRVEIYSKTNLRKPPIRNWLGMYEKKYYDLYDSYSFSEEQKLKKHNRGVERRTDKRGNIFRSPMVKFGLPLSIMGLISSIWWFISYFDSFGSKDKDKSKIAPPPPVVAAPAPSHSQVASLSPQSNTSSNTQKTILNSSEHKEPEKPKEPKESSSIGISGYYKVGDKTYVLLRSSDKQRVLVNPKDFEIQDMLRIEGKFQGDIVNTYTGSGIRVTPQSSSQGNSNQPNTMDIVPAGAKQVSERVNALPQSPVR
jgi:zona occludens toxin